MCLGDVAVHGRAGRQRMEELVPTLGGENSQTGE